MMQPRAHPKVMVTDDKLLSEESGELQFINLSSNYNGDPNTKKVVRKHVMTKFRRDQRKEQNSASKSKSPKEAPRSKPKLPKPEKLDINTAISSSTHTRRTVRSPLSDFQPRQIPIRHNSRTPEIDPQEEPENETQLISMPTNLGAGRDDPFSSLPLQNSPHTAYLLDHFNQFITWRRSHLPNTLFASFFSYSLTDPALAHAMMIYAANHDQFSTGRPRVMDICYHKGEAIRILNSRISSLNISDETIVTIAEMVIFEVSDSKASEVTVLEEMFGDSESASVHRNGLQKLVQLRGGIHKLGTPNVSIPFVGQALILPSSASSWENSYACPTPETSYMTPIRTPSPSPYSMSIPSTTTFKPPESPTAIATKTAYLSTCECSIPHPPYPPTRSGWDEIMKETFIRLKDSSSLFSSTIHTVYGLPIHNESYLVESRIVQLIQGFETEDKSDNGVKVVYGKSWALGCRIFLYTVLRCSASRLVRGDVLQGLIEELRYSLTEEFRGYEEVYQSFDGGTEYGAGVTTGGFHQKYYSSDVLLWVLLVGGSNAMSLPNTKTTTSLSPIASPLPSPTQHQTSIPIPKLTSPSTTTASPELTWYLSAIKHLTHGLQIRTWHGVKTRMDQLPWVEWKIEEKYRKFWEMALFPNVASREEHSDVWTVFCRSDGPDIGVGNGNENGNRNGTSSRTRTSKVRAEKKKGKEL